MTFTSTFNTFNDFYLPRADKVHAPPPKVKSWNRHWILCFIFDVTVDTFFLQVSLIVFYVYVLNDLCYIGK